MRSLYLNDENTILKSNPITLTQLVEDTIRKEIGHPQNKAVYTGSGTVMGACGGSAYVTLSVNDATGNFWGNIAYSNYCESGVTISGNAGISGRIDMVTDDVINMTITFDNLTGTSYGESVT